MSKKQFTAEALTTIFGCLKVPMHFLHCKFLSQSSKREDNEKKRFKLSFKIISDLTIDIVWSTRHPQFLCENRLSSKCIQRRRSISFTSYLLYYRWRAMRLNWHHCNFRWPIASCTLYSMWINTICKLTSILNLQILADSRISTYYSFQSNNLICNTFPIKLIEKTN